MTTMKPFNLERALAGDPVVTRDGRNVIQLAHFLAAPLPAFRLQVLVEGEQYPLGYCANGAKSASGDLKEYDLFMAPKTRFARVVQYPGCVPFVCGTYGTRASAETMDTTTYKVLPAIEYTDE